MKTLLSNIYSVKTGIQYGYRRLFIFLLFLAMGRITHAQVTSLSAVGSTSNANGATITGNILNLQPASEFYPGVVTTGTQIFQGDKSFRGIFSTTGLNAAGWTYLAGNANGEGPLPAFNYGIMTAWNPSAGYGESQILYGTGQGAGPRLDFGRWTGSTKYIDASFSGGNFYLANNLLLGSTTAPGSSSPTYINLGSAYSTTAGANLKLKLYNDPTLVWGLGISPGQMDYVTTTAGSHCFYVGDVPYKAMYIQGSTGNIGIGTSTPNSNARLDVAGNIYSSGKIVIGTTDATQIGSYSLAVNGDAIFKKVKVKLYGSWADYVFEEDYNLLSLNETEQYIKLNKHLPGVPSALEVKANGLDLEEGQTMLIRKVEELTLYIIEMNKKIEYLTSENMEIRKQIK